MSDGSYLIVGKTSQGATQNMLVTELDANFNINWSKTYSGTGAANAKDLALMTNGNLLVTGQGNNGESTVILELDRSGNVITSSELGFLDDRMRNVTKAPDGGLLVYGELEGVVGGRNKLAIVFYEPDFRSVRWAKYYDHTTSSDNLANYEVQGRNLVRTADQGYLFLGNYAQAVSPVTTRKIRMLKVDQNGVPQWVRGIHGGGLDNGTLVAATSDNGFVVCMTTNSYSNDGSDDVALAKFDDQANMVWLRNYQSSGSQNATYLVQSGDGGYLVAGSTSAYGFGGSDGFLLKTDSDGNEQWARTYGDTNDETILKLDLLSDGYLLSGHTNSFNQGKDIFLVKTDVAGNVSDSCTFDATPLISSSSETPIFFNENYTEMSFSAPTPFSVAVTDVTFNENLVCESCQNFTLDLGQDTTLCAGQELTLGVQLAGVNYTWQDGSNNSNFTVSEPGTYWLTVTDSCLTQADTIAVSYLGSTGWPTDTVLCDAGPFILNTSTTTGTYLWSDGSTDSTLSVTGPGLYWVEITGSTCMTRDSINVWDSNSLSLTFPETIVACRGDTVVLDASNPGATYLWSDNSTASTVEILTAGSYSVEVTNNCGVMQSRTSTITFEDNCECDVYFPTAFSPNADGLNDQFNAVLGCQLESYNLSIFNRWGELIFHSEDTGSGWNGSFKGKRSPSDQYVYKVTYKILGDPSPVIQKRGGVYLMD